MVPWPAQSLIQYKDTLDRCHSWSLTGYHHASPFTDLLEPNCLPDLEMDIEDDDEMKKSLK